MRALTVVRSKLFPDGPSVDHDREHIRAEANAICEELGIDVRLTGGMTLDEYFLGLTKILHAMLRRELERSGK